MRTFFEASFSEITFLLRVQESVFLLWWCPWGKTSLGLFGLPVERDVKNGIQFSRSLAVLLYAYILQKAVVREDAVSDILHHIIGDNKRVFALK